MPLALTGSGWLARVMPRQPSANQGAHVFYYCVCIGGMGTVICLGKKIDVTIVDLEHTKPKSSGPAPSGERWSGSRQQRARPPHALFAAPGVWKAPFGAELARRHRCHALARLDRGKKAVADTLQNYPSMSRILGKLVEADLYEPPLTVFGRNAVERFFTPREIRELLELLHTFAA
jgi:hypothetical protein